MRTTITALGLLLLAGCPGQIDDPALFGAPGTGGGAGGGSCSLDVHADILVPSCGADGCHGAGSSQLDLDLASEGFEARLVDAPAQGCDGRRLVVPGDPDTSYLIEKIEGTPECGDRMPIIGELTQEELTCIRLWVTSLGDEVEP